jgi:hypothetical protein
MRHAFFHFLVLILALSTGLVPQSAALATGAKAPAAAPAQEHSTAAADQPAAPLPDAAADPDAGPSPWEHGLWHNATTMMRIYVCDHARRPPSWCGEPSLLPANVALPDVQGPPLIEEDARWLAFLESANPASLSGEDVATIRRRAIERRDPQAMEILGFIYAEGQSVRRDYAEAYRWYGLAYLSGEQRVRPNMDVVWQQLQRYDLEGALALTREFNSLSNGEVPAGLLPVPAASAPAAAAAQSAQ